MLGLSWQMWRAETGAYLGVREDFEHPATMQMAAAVAFQQPARLPAPVQGKSRPVEGMRVLPHHFGLGEPQCRGRRHATA